jgi:hypothetical protein
MTAVASWFSQAEVDLTRSLNISSITAHGDELFQMVKQSKA